ncbi:sigma-54-dependent Fis family transcriptional regulator [bacterium]|nr:sigma-54-dependent Fis family transcriptional regulator [bacterium]
MVRILVVDDEESMCKFMRIMLSKSGYEVATALSAKEALALLDKSSFDIAILDIKMPEMSGVELLREIRKKNQTISVIMMTAYASLETAIEALREGASDYITKPFQISEIRHSIKRILEERELREENVLLREQVSEGASIDEFVGSSPKILEMKELIKTIAPTDSTVLILGESGTGKELVARAIHRLSGRADAPFISVNCGALPEQLLESELFGHKKGSFTGAVRDKEGLMKAADRGTLFLDEIGDTSMAIQVKLLRAIEEKEIIPIGSTSSVKVDVRIIAATNSNLEDMVRKGAFRADLYYRLNVFPISIPPLRERREDIIPIADHFLKKLVNRMNDKREVHFSETAKKLLKKAYWAGNVRELENVIERAYFLSKDGVITERELPEHIRKGEQPIAQRRKQSLVGGILPLEEIEKAYIFYTLNRVGWKKTEAARALGIDPSTLYRKIEKYKLTPQKTYEENP